MGLTLFCQHVNGFHVADVLVCFVFFLLSFFFFFFFAPFVYGLVRIIHTRCVLRCGLPTCSQLCVPVYSSDETITKAPALTLIFLFSFFLCLLCTALYEIFTLTACCGGASTSARGAAPSCTAAVTAVRVRGGLFFLFSSFFFALSLYPLV